MFLTALLLAAPFMRGAELPRKSPDFAIALNGGRQLRLSRYRGKVVVLAFILTACPHCQQTVAFLSKDQNELDKQGLQVIACAIERDAPQNVPGFIQKFRPPFPVGYNTDPGAVLAYLQHPPAEVPYMPMLVFIDRQGMIRAQYEGRDPFVLDETKQEQNLRARIEELLGAPGGKPASKAPNAKKSPR
jgi:peroxiredoxin